MTTRARGADFSSAQPVAEVARVAKTIDFAFVKATQGVDYVNPLLGRQAFELRTAGVLVGYYHFLDPASDGAAQWDHFELHLLGLTRGPVALDYEAKGTTDAQARAFLRRGRQRGYRVGLYGGVPICRRRLGQAWRWVAYWSQTPPQTRYDVWQFTDGAGRQDYNVFRGALHHDLTDWWAKQTRPLRRNVRPRWWLTDGQTALGPYWLVQAAARLVTYARTHPKTRSYTLERK